MLLLFRTGDFYELYGEDAEIAAKTVGLCLTCRTDMDTREKVSMAGFPHHALEKYLRDLLKAGHRVAVCDQVEDIRSKETAAHGQATLF